MSRKTFLIIVIILTLFGCDLVVKPDNTPMPVIVPPAPMQPIVVEKPVEETPTPEILPTPEEKILKEIIEETTETMQAASPDPTDTVYKPDETIDEDEQIKQIVIQKAKAVWKEYRENILLFIAKIIAYVTGFFLAFHWLVRLINRYSSWKLGYTFVVIALASIGILYVFIIL